MWLMKVLPESTARTFARSIVRLFLIVMKRARPVALRNLDLAFPDKTDEWKKQTAEKSFNVLAENILTFARLDKLVSKLDHEKIVNVSEMLDKQSQMETDKSGLILVSMHFGCFELYAQTFSLGNSPLIILAREFGLPRLDAFWTKKRESFGSKVFDRKGGYKNMIRHLKKGHTVAILPDQNVKKNHADFVEFFGHQTSFSKAVAMASMATGSRLLLSCMAYDNEGKHKILTREIPRPQDLELESKEEKIQQTCQNIATEMENFIRAYPENWFWIHRRWKTRPEGEPETVYQGI